VRPLTIVVGNPGLTKSLSDGTTPCGHLTLNFIPVDPLIAAMRRMVRDLEFDICEMALSTYLCARNFGKVFTAIPVFPARNFHHRAMFCNIHSGIAGPKDLEGRTVGVHRGYTVTTGLWARGILQTDYGVDLKRITWAATGDEHVAEYQAPPNVNYSYKGKATAELLASGEIGAAVGDIRVDSPEVKPLIPDSRNAAIAYYRKTGIYPVNHCLVIRNEILDAEPWVAEELFNAFTAAKKSYFALLDRGVDLSPADEAVISLGRAVGGDPFPFGVNANRKALEAIVQFAFDQQVIAKKPGLEELFTQNTLTLE